MVDRSANCLQSATGGSADPRKSLEKSLKLVCPIRPFRGEYSKGLNRWRIPQLGVDQVDLYLIHSPLVSHLENKGSGRNLS